jgi:hypothetical protein
VPHAAAEVEASHTAAVGLANPRAEEPALAARSVVVRLQEEPGSFAAACRRSAEEGSAGLAVEAVGSVDLAGRNRLGLVVLQGHGVSICCFCVSIVVDLRQRQREDCSPLSCCHRISSPRSKLLRRSLRQLLALRSRS